MFKFLKLTPNEQGRVLLSLEGLRKIQSIRNTVYAVYADDETEVLYEAMNYAGSSFFIDNLTDAKYCENDCIDSDKLAGDANLHTYKNVEDGIIRCLKRNASEVNLAEVLQYCTEYVRGESNLSMYLVDKEAAIDSLGGLEEKGLLSVVKDDVVVDSDDWAEDQDPSQYTVRLNNQEKGE